MVVCVFIQCLAWLLLFSLNGSWSCHSHTLTATWPIIKTNNRTSDLSLRLIIRLSMELVTHLSLSSLSIILIILLPADVAGTSFIQSLHLFNSISWIVKSIPNNKAWPSPSQATASSDLSQKLVKDSRVNWLHNLNNHANTVLKSFPFLKSIHRPTHGDDLRNPDTPKQEYQWPKSNKQIEWRKCSPGIDCYQSQSSGPATLQNCGSNQQDTYCYIREVGEETWPDNIWHMTHDKWDDMTCYDTWHMRCHDT